MRYILKTTVKEKRVYKFALSLFLLYCGFLAKILNLLILVVLLRLPTQF